MRSIGAHRLLACTVSTALITAFPIAGSAKSKTRVIFTSPCECEGNHGISRWTAKIDLSEPPANSADIRNITPAQIMAWQGPGGTIGQRTERISAEQQWYSVTGRVDKMRIEDDGDVHIVLRDLTSGTGMVVELPLGPRWCELRKLVFSWTDAQFPLTGKFRLREHPVITVTGKAFYDIDHSGNDTLVNRRSYDGSLAIWEIHPVMKIKLESPDKLPTAVSATPHEDSVPQTAMTVPPATTDEQFVTLTQAVTVQVPHGSAVLQPGMKLPVLSRDSKSVDVRYMDARYTIPLSSTDLR